MRFRKMTWALIIWSAVMLFWVVTGLGSVEPCAPGDTACEAGMAIGAGIAIFMIGGVWFVGFIVLSIIWFMTRPARTA